MEHRDAELSDITVVLKAECAEKLDDTVAELRKLEMEIDQTDADNGIVEGTVRADKLANIRSFPCVQYVRVEFTYIADYPSDDPRNLDPADEGVIETDD